MWRGAGGREGHRGGSRRLQAVCMHTSARLAKGDQQVWYQICTSKRWQACKRVLLWMALRVTCPPWPLSPDHGGKLYDQQHQHQDHAANLREGHGMRG